MFAQYRIDFVQGERSGDQLSLIEYKRMDFRKLTTIGGGGVSGRLEPWGWGEESLINIIISYLKKASMTDQENGIRESRSFSKIKRIFFPSLDANFGIECKSVSILTKR